MKLPLSFINEYVDISDVPNKEYAHKMTMSGSKVEGIESPGEHINNIVTGKILSCDKHPDADKLKVCSVDIGTETVQIITGAPNVKAGDLIPVAKVGAKLPGGIVIKEAKLRGLPSFGMMCSHEELGIPMESYKGANNDGVLIILEDFTPGTDIKDVLSLNESIVEFEITSNRPDCLGAIGMARETALTFNKPFIVKEPVVKGSGGDINDYIKISVKDFEKCKRYTAKVIKNVKIMPSPQWAQKRLLACGMRPINNIVDITNLVMLEYAQPMHAFDLTKINGAEIIVRKAEENESFTALDSTKHKLNSNMLVIADCEKPVALAGVIGGENSEIYDNTATILFESANFEGGSVRQTASLLGIRTESSLRFEKGLDYNATVPAIMRACELIEEFSSGDVVDGIIDIKVEIEEAVKIELNAEKICEFLGCKIEKSFMEETLIKLGFKVENGFCIPPSFRIDIEGFADIAEEIARFYGYDNIPVTLMGGTVPKGGRTEGQILENEIKNILSAMGMYEIFTYSFTSPNIYDRLCYEKDDEIRNSLKIINPLGEETSVMRRTTFAAMLENLSRNYNFRNKEAKLFELGKVYHPENGKDLPLEPVKITLGMYGNGDFYSLKGIIEELFSALKVKGVSFMPCNTHKTFHPGICAKIFIGKKEAGIIGEVHPLVLENYEIETKAYAAEIDLELLKKNIVTDIKFKPLPKFPSVSRDIAVLIDDAVSVINIENIIREAAGGLLEEVQLFDVYKGAQIEKGKKSVAYSFTLRSADKTLTDEEVSAVTNKVLTNLKDKFNAILR